jgi:hypothetical protein
MLVTCQICGTEFETKSTRAKFCGSTCRSRGHRSGTSAAPVVPLPASPDDPEAVAPLLAATKHELEDAGVADTALGQQAIELARRMSDPRAMGLSVAPISKELRSVMAEAMKDAPRASGLDELRARRDRKRHAG